MKSGKVQRMTYTTRIPKYSWQGIWSTQCPMGPMAKPSEADSYLLFRHSNWGAKGVGILQMQINSVSQEGLGVNFAKVFTVFSGLKSCACVWSAVTIWALYSTLVSISPRCNRWAYCKALYLWKIGVGGNWQSRRSKTRSIVTVRLTSLKTKEVWSSSPLIPRNPE